MKLDIQKDLYASEVPGARGKGTVQHKTKPLAGSGGTGVLPRSLIRLRQGKSKM